MNGITPEQFNAAIATLQEGRAEGRLYYHNVMMLDQIHGRDEWPGGEAHVARFKPAFIEDWVERLREMPATEAAYAFCDAWTVYDCEMMCAFVSEMVENGILEPTLTDGMAVTTGREDLPPGRAHRFQAGRCRTD